MSKKIKKTRQVGGHDVHEVEPRALVVGAEERAAVGVDGADALEGGEEGGVDGAVAEGGGVGGREGVAVEERGDLGCKGG